MTQKSYFWDGTATGDATLAPYSAATEFAKVMMSLAAAACITTHLGGVFRDELGEFMCFGINSPGNCSSGRALCYGSVFESDDNEPLNISTPAGSTRIDRLVVRKDWAAQTTRLAVITGVPGGAAPALTQTPGSVWEIPLYQISITTGGAITYTDERDFIPRYAHQHLGTRDDSAQIVLGSLPGGLFTADAAGRAKFANGFVTPALMGSTWPTATVHDSDTDVVVGGTSEQALCVTSITLPDTGIVQAIAWAIVTSTDWSDLGTLRLLIDAGNYGPTCRFYANGCVMVMYRLSGLAAGVHPVTLLAGTGAGQDVNFLDKQIMVFSSKA